MDPLPGFKERHGTRVCKLKKYLYGLKQSPKAWFERFTQYVKTTREHSRTRISHHVYATLSLGKDNYPGSVC